jgi:hypothetical protein
MNCFCSKLPQLVKADQLVNAGVNLFVHFDTMQSGGGNNWTNLIRCRHCEQHWRIDVSDKYQIQFAVKIDDINHWQEFDDLPLRKKFLLESRGGLTEEKCIWQGCSNYRVKGVAYCLDHLFQTGARQ